MDHDSHRRWEADSEATDVSDSGVQLDPADLDDAAFDDARIDRRDFVRLSMATGASLALPGTATAAVSSDVMTAEYQYVLGHTPDDHRVQSLVTFSDATGIDALEAALDVETITTTEPRPAAYAELTTVQAQQAASLPTAETIHHSPGANPFWRIGYYPFGVFPDTYRSTDYIAFEENVRGLQHLAAANPDRLDVFPIGKSPGHDNQLSDRVDPKDVWVAEVTNDITDEASFREKEKVFASLSVHGNERAGAEAGSRFIEGLLRGTEPETETLLDDAVLVFVYANPDGWVARKPQYSTAPRYERGNARVGDTNRQYPIAGWIDPSHYPSEPKGANAADDQPGVDADVPDEYLEHVPDSLAIVEHFRGYENLNYGADYHGMSVADNFVLGLISQDQFDHRALHELYEMNRVIDENLGDNHDPSPYASDSYDYSTIWDTLGYTDSGFMGDWMAHPEETGGIGLTSMDFEMTLSNIVGQNFYSPHLMEAQVVGYQEGFRTMAAFAVENSDTPHTDDQFAADIETGGHSTAVVATDALTRHSDQLEFLDQDDGDGGGGGTLPVVSRTTATPALDEGYGTAGLSVPEGTHTLSIRMEPDAAPVAADLVDPSGDLVRTTDPAAGAAVSGTQPAWVVRDPTAGEWTVELGAVSLAAPSDAASAAVADPSESVAVRATTLQASSTTQTPDPEPVTGYAQFDYKVSPLVFFDNTFIPDDDPLRVNDADSDYDDVTDAPVDLLTIDDVIGGAHQSYDNLVVIHADGSDDGAYTDALDSFVDQGGNLVLTDTGTHLLGAMETDLASAIAPESIEDQQFYVAHLGTKTADHPLLDGARPIQNQLYKIVPLGYSIGTEAPATLIEQGAFEEAGGIAAGVNDGYVSAGSLLGPGASGTTRDVVGGDAGSIHFICGLLPPGFQENLHPFGLLDYSTSFLGHTMLTNALGYVQRRYVGGDAVATFGGESEFTGGGTPGDSLSASGSRADDGSVFTGGQTNTVDITVETASHEAEIADAIPDGWTVLEDYFDVTRVADGQVFLENVTPEDVAESSVTRTYAIEAPEGVDQTGAYDFGPAEAIAVDFDDTAEIAGTETNYVVGPSTSV